MTWRDPKSGEKRLNRGTEWFRIEDGRIAEVRAYHHGDRKNPQGEPLGFDHAARGHTTMDDWKAPRITNGERSSRTPAGAPCCRPSPRSTRSCASRCAASSATRSRPTSTSGRQAREFPRELYARCGELGFLGLKYPEELGGQGGDYVHDAVWTEELARSGASGGVGGGARRAQRDRDAADLQLRHTDQHQRLLVPAIRGEKIGALGITEPGAGSDVAVDPDLRAKGRRRLRRQRLEDLHHQRRPRRLPRLRGQDHRGGRPPRDLLPGPGARHARLRGLAQAREDGLALVRHRRARRSPTSRSPRRTCSARRTGASTW